MDEKTRLKARELLLRSRIYRFIALVFAVIGLGVFFYLYFKHIEGNVVQALKEPAIIMVVLVPFLPAFVLSWMAVRAENKFMTLLEELKGAEAGKAKTDKK